MTGDEKQVMAYLETLDIHTYVTGKKSIPFIIWIEKYKIDSLVRKKSKKKIKKLFFKYQVIVHSGNIILVKTVKKVTLSDSSVRKTLLFMIFYSILLNW